MKWFIASDIHGSLYYAEKMVEAYKKEKADKMLLLGDILYHGPRNDLPRNYCPKQVIPLLNAEKERILCVRGNCDAEVDQMVLDFSIMDDFVLLDSENVLIFATHGHVYNEEKLPDGDFDILIHGHTHVPVVVEHDNYVYINPGSVSIPKEDSHHGYMIYEKGTFLWKNFDGDTVREYNFRRN